MIRRFRHRRLIALWALLSLVLSQWALAAHWCPNAGSGPAASVHVAPPVQATSHTAGHHCADSAVVDAKAPLADTLCKAHCADHAKICAGGKALAIPPQPWAVTLQVAWQPAALHRTAVHRRPEGRHRLDRRRIEAFGVRLI